MFFTSKLSSQSLLLEGLDDYLSASRRYRGAARLGAVIIVEKTDMMNRFFQFLIKKCGLKVVIKRAETVQDAKGFVDIIGGEDVKAMIIDEGMIGDSINGDSLPGWIWTNYPCIPIWIVNCGFDKKAWIREQTLRLGIITEDPYVNVVEELGLSSECHEAATGYTG